MTKHPRDNSSNGTNSAKWKDALLRTSLPLEYLVGKNLVKNDLILSGEYSFNRRNEESIDTEFSIDLRASELLEKKGFYWGYLNFLVECKYSYRNVKWVFSPHHDSYQIESDPVSPLQDLTTKRIPHSAPVFRCTDQLPVCAKGIELHTSDVNPQAITRGLHQLRFAAGRLASELVEEQISALHEEDLLIGLVCPILVTTASLFVLKERTNLKRIENSSRLDQFANSTDALVVAAQYAGPQIRSYTTELITDLHARFPDIRRRLEQLHIAYRMSTMAKGAGWSDTMKNFNRSIQLATNNVLVVTFEAFDRTVASIRRAAADSGRQLVTFANLGSDQYGRGVWIEPSVIKRSRPKR